MMKLWVVIARLKKLQIMTELRKQFKTERPETVGETDSAFDNSNYIDWLEAKIKELNQGQTLPIDSVSNCDNCDKEKETTNLCDDCLTQCVSEGN